MHRRVKIELAAVMNDSGLPLVWKERSRDKNLCGVVFFLSIFQLLVKLSSTMSPLDVCTKADIETIFTTGDII